MWANNKKVIFGLLIFICISSPVVLYFMKFGTTYSINVKLSNTNADWGSFGSYIAGIYTPIFSALSIILLYQQNKTQRLIIEQADAIRIREEASFYLKIIDEHINTDSKLLEILIQNFSKIVEPKINITKNELLLIATNINNDNPQIFRAWYGFNISLASLKTYKNSSFKYHFTSTKLLPVNLFGFDICVALDNYCHIQSNMKQPFGEYSHSNSLWT